MGMDGGRRGKVGDELRIKKFGARTDEEEAQEIFRIMDQFFKTMPQSGVIMIARRETHGCEGIATILSISGMEK